MMDNSLRVLLLLVIYCWVAPTVELRCKKVKKYGDKKVDMKGNRARDLTDLLILENTFNTIDSPGKLVRWRYRVAEAGEFFLDVWRREESNMVLINKTLCGGRKAGKTSFFTWPIEVEKGDHLGCHALNTGINLIAREGATSDWNCAGYRTSDAEIVRQKGRVGRANYAGSRLIRLAMEAWVLEQGCLGSDNCSRCNDRFRQATTVSRFKAVLYATYQGESAISCGIKCSRHPDCFIYTSKVVGECRLWSGLFRPDDETVSEVTLEDRERMFEMKYKQS